jgi:hypothetical protein
MKMSLKSVQSLCLHQLLCVWSFLELKSLLVKQKVSQLEYWLALRVSTLSMSQPLVSL